MKNLLLPFRWKFRGWILTSLGLVLSTGYLFFDMRFTLPVFAISSSYMETKFFTVFTTNFADELILLLLLSGLGLVIFSAEKDESEKYKLFRYQALTRAFGINIAINLLAILFIYGAVYIGFLVINLFSIQLTYLYFFYNLKRKEQKRDNTIYIQNETMINV